MIGSEEQKISDVFSKLIRVLICGAFMLWPPQGSVQGVEVNFGKAAYLAANNAMNAAIRNAEKTMPTKEFTELQIGQKDWLAQRSLRISSFAAYHELTKENYTSTADYWRTETSFTKTRTKIISALANSEAISKKTWEGTWEDGYGGVVEIKEIKDGSFAFLITCVRGPEKHKGEISGIAETNKLQGRFSVKLPPEKPYTKNGVLISPVREVWVTFVKNSKRLQVFGANTDWFHGQQAYFDGTYIRTSKFRSIRFNKSIQNIE